MASSGWKLLKVLKEIPHGSVWLVRDSSGNRGYFKFAKKKHWYYSGPLIANEYIAASLAKRLGFPTAHLVFAAFREQNGDLVTGVISRKVSARQIMTWSDACRRYQYPEDVVYQNDLLRQLIVFDAWITNIDRGLGKNLILYRNRSGSNYNWYLIDHGHALFGAPQKWKLRGKWNSQNWEKLWRCCKAPPGIVPMHLTLSDLMPMIQKIEALRESDIDRALDDVPNGYLSQQIRGFTKRLLLFRQKKLRKIMYRWLRYRNNFPSSKQDHDKHEPRRSHRHESRGSHRHKSRGSHSFSGSHSSRS